MGNAPLCDLTGKVALVTGASRGIGRAVAFTLARHGADVLVNSRKRDGAEAAGTFAPHLDILVLNAGISPVYARAEAHRPGAFLCARALAPFLTARPGGRVLVMASIGGLVGLPRLAAYNATKGGLLQLTRTLALEWAQHGVRVNALAPGFIETDMTASLRDHPGLRRTLLQRVPMGRFGLPEEVAAAALFLVSDAAAYITGTVLTVDGGWTAA